MTDELLVRARAFIAEALGAVWNGTVLETGTNSLALELDADEDRAHSSEGSFCLWLSEIEVETPGTRLGFRALEALRRFCKQEQVTLYVGPVVAGVWEHPQLGWLDDAGFDLHGDPVYYYRPRP
jgi:hypothetical protein